MPKLEENRLTIYILASRQEERYTQELWKHMASMRRQLHSVAWANPLYIEDMATSNAVVPTLPNPSIVIACLSPSLLAALLDQPALRELVQSADHRFPFIFSPCAWNEYPSPFRGLMPIAYEAISTTSRRDNLFIQAMGRIREVLIRFLEER